MPIFQLILRWNIPVTLLSKPSGIASELPGVPPYASFRKSLSDSGCQIGSPLVNHRFNFLGPRPGDSASITAFPLVETESSWRIHFPSVNYDSNQYSFLFILPLVTPRAI